MIEPAFVHAIRFAAASPTIRVDTGTLQTLTLGVAEGVDYFMAGDGEADDLVQILEDCLNTNGDGVTFVVTLEARSFIKVVADAAIDILWTDGLTTVDGALFGFDADASGTSFYAPDQTQGVWIPGTAARPVAPRTDTRLEPVTVGALVEAIDGSSRGYDLSSSRGERVISFHLIDRAKILTEYAAADEPYGALEHPWTNGLCRGREVRYYEDHSVRTPTSYERYRVRARGRPWREMGVTFIQRYEVELELREV